MLIRVEGIVIRTIDYGEGHKIITLITPTHGKFGVVVRGAKKPKSRFGFLAQLFVHGDFAVYRSGRLGTLKGGELVEPFRELRERLDLAACASYAAELTDRAIPDEEAGEHLFHQLLGCLTALAQGKDPEVVLRIYEMKIFRAAGYAPVLDACAACGVSERLGWFSAAAGGALCAACRPRDPDASALGEPARKLLQLFARLDLRRVGQTDVKDETKRQLREATRRWLEAHLDLRLKTLPFLDLLGRGGN
ncbi:MAG: DNA repair protein RecO [Paenibacillaceae bacterium ZCTH02-B3]|nr:MAG: DNA repair protein RecO [Paenibacillaceae bacterium ZCTH02-B3]